MVDTPVGYVTLPRLTDAVIKTITNPTLGSIVYSITQNSIVTCVATSTVTGATGTCKIVTLGLTI